MDGSKSETNRNPLHQLKKNLIGVYGTTISCKLCRFRDAAIVKIQQRIYLRHNEPFVVREHNNKNNKKRKKKAICCVFLERSSQIGWCLRCGCVHRGRQRCLSLCSSRSHRRCRLRKKRDNIWKTNSAWIVYSSYLRYYSEFCYFFQFVSINLAWIKYD